MARYKGNLIWDATFVVAREVILDILYFPFWWYTLGLKERFFNLQEKIKNIAHALALPILFRHLLKPMYGDYTLSGRIISFFVRIIHFSVLSGVGLIFITIYLILFFLYLILPILVILALLHQLTGKIF